MRDENEQKTTGESGSGKSVDWKSEDAFWRKQHPNQPYADKNRPYEDYAPAYRVGVEGAKKHSGKEYDEVEHSLATEYERSEPGSAIPWDSARPAVKAAWDRLAGVISPRDSDRGIRGSI